MNLRLINLFLILMLILSTFACGFASEFSGENSTDNKTEKTDMDYSTNSIVAENQVTSGLADESLNDNCIYVDCVSGSDENSGTNSSKPKKTIANAIQSSQEDGIVFINALNYNEDNIRIEKNIKLVGSKINAPRPILKTHLCVKSNVRVSIENLEFSGCVSDKGGAIFNEGNLTLKNCRFEGNKAFLGGAIYNQAAINSSIPTLNIVNTIFEGNSADSNGGYGAPEYSGGAGGAIFSKNASCYISECNFAYNVAAQDGGAINNNREGNLIINKTNFNKNKCTNGGVVYNTNNCSVFDSKIENNVGKTDGGAFYNTGKLCVYGSYLSGNQAQFSKGGAIYTSNNCFVDNNSITDNNAVSGGGIHNYGSCEVNNNKFIRNEATLGGAITTNGTKLVKLNSNIFDNNKAGGSGGALITQSPTYIENNNFMNNGAICGGAIYNQFVGYDTWPSIILKNNKFNHNNANYGGALANIGRGNLIQNIFEANLSPNGDSAAIWNDYGGVLNFEGGNKFFSHYVGTGSNYAILNKGSMFLIGDINDPIELENTKIKNDYHLVMKYCSIQKNTKYSELISHSQASSKDISHITYKNDKHYYVEPQARTWWWDFRPVHIDPINDITVKKGQKVTINAQLWLEDGFLWHWLDEAGSDRPLLVSIYNRNNCKTDTIKTDMSGWIHYDFTRFEPGVYTVQVSYCGTNDRSNFDRYCYVTVTD